MFQFDFLFLSNIYNIPLLSVSKLFAAIYNFIWFTLRLPLRIYLSLIFINLNYLNQYAFTLSVLFISGKFLYNLASSNNNIKVELSRKVETISDSLNTVISHYALSPILAFTLLYSTVCRVDKTNHQAQRSTMCIMLLTHHLFVGSIL